MTEQTRAFTELHNRPMAVCSCRVLAQRVCTQDRKAASSCNAVAKLLSSVRVSKRIL